MPSGRLPDLPEQRRYKTLRRRLDAFRATHPEGVNRWIDGTVAGYERHLTKLAESIEAQGRKVP